MRIWGLAGATTQAELTDVSTPHVAADIATDAIETAEIKDGEVTDAKLGTDLTIGAGHITIKPYAYDTIVQGTWTWYNHNTVIPENVVFSTTTGPADGDELSFKVYLPKGDYKLIVAHAVQNAAAIVDFHVDGVERHSIDMYAGSSTWANISTSAQFSIAAKGIKTVRMVVDGKHGSSSGYQCIVYSIIIYKVA